MKPILIFLALAAVAAAALILPSVWRDATPNRPRFRVGQTVIVLSPLMPTSRVKGPQFTGRIVGITPRQFASDPIQYRVLFAPDEPTSVVNAAEEFIRPLPEDPRDE